MKRRGRGGKLPVGNILNTLWKGRGGAMSRIGKTVGLTPEANKVYREMNKQARQRNFRRYKSEIKQTVAKVKGAVERFRNRRR